jgi:protein required for attachment to host cells
MWAARGNIEQTNWRLVIVAPPKVLGALREALHKEAESVEQKEPGI